MIHTPVVNLKKGMTVAKPIVIQGRTLLSIGSQLTEKHMQIFKAWGVTDVWIEGEADATLDNAQDVKSEEFVIIKEQIERRFKKCDKNSEVISELKRIAITREIAGYEQLKLSTGGQE